MLLQSKKYSSLVMKLMTRSPGVPLGTLGYIRHAGERVNDLAVLVLLGALWKCEKCEVGNC